jgi:hypothetical protein
VADWKKLIADMLQQQQHIVNPKIKISLKEQTYIIPKHNENDPEKKIQKIVRRTNIKIIPKRNSTPKKKDDFVKKETKKKKSKNRKNQKSKQLLGDLVGLEELGITVHIQSKKKKNRLFQKNLQNKNRYLIPICVGRHLLCLLSVQKDI